MRGNGGGEGVISSWRSRISWSLIDSCAKLALLPGPPVIRGGLGELSSLPIATVTAAANCRWDASPIFGKFLRIIASCS